MPPSVRHRQSRTRRARDRGPAATTDRCRVACGLRSASVCRVHRQWRVGAGDGRAGRAAGCAKLRARAGPGRGPGARRARLARGRLHRGAPVCGAVCFSFFSRFPIPLSSRRRQRRRHPVDLRGDQGTDTRQGQAQGRAERGRRTAAATRKRTPHGAAGAVRVRSAVLGAPHGACRPQHPRAIVASPRRGAALRLTSSSRARAQPRAAVDDGRAPSAALGRARGKPPSSRAAAVPRRPTRRPPPRASAR